MIVRQSVDGFTVTTLLNKGTDQSYGPVALPKHNAMLFLPLQRAILVICQKSDQIREHVVQELERIKPFTHSGANHIRKT
jgi:hypothetical protein